MPPFYIGSTSLDKIKNGYSGSVASKKYKHIWKQELKLYPEKFRTVILTRHSSRKEALEKEAFFHKSLSAQKNCLYINQATADGNFYIDKQFFKTEDGIKTRKKISKGLIQDYLNNPDSRNKRKNSLHIFFNSENGHELKKYRSSIQKERMKDENLRCKQGITFKKNYYANISLQESRSQLAKDHMSDPLKRKNCLNGIHKKIKCPYCDHENNSGNLKRHIMKQHGDKLCQ